MTILDLSVTVIIPSYGVNNDLSPVLEALAAQTVSPQEVIVVHSGKFPPQLDASDQPPGLKLTILHHPGRLFPGSARNRGARHARSQLLAFVNVNVIPQSDWIERLLAAYKFWCRPCVVGAVNIRSRPTFWEGALWLSEFSAVHPYVPSNPACHHGAGSNILVERTAFLNLKGFPEEYRAAEDVILFHRFRSRGNDVAYVNDAVVTYSNPVSWRHCLRHSYMLGGWSATARILGYGNRARLSRMPIFLPWLGLYRSLLLLVRIMGSRKAVAIRNVKYFPGALASLLVWNVGFFAGLRRPLYLPQEHSG